MPYTDEQVKIEKVTEMTLGITQEDIINKIYKNVAQDIVYTTIDKLKLNLNEFESSFKKTYSSKGMALTYISIFITIIATIFTATFKDIYAIPATFIKYTFMIAAIYTIIAAISYFMKYKKEEKLQKTINQMIEIIAIPNKETK